MFYSFSIMTGLCNLCKIRPATLRYRIGPNKLWNRICSTCFSNRSNSNFKPIAFRHYSAMALFRVSKKPLFKP